MQYAPDYVSYETYDNEGVILLSRRTHSLSDSITIYLSDPGGFNTTQTVSVSVYKTYLSSDVRPWGDDLNGDGDSDDAGEFGDNSILASDVINALRVSTEVTAALVLQQQSL